MSFNGCCSLLKKTEGVIIDANRLFLVRFNVKGNYINKFFSYIDFLTKELVYEILN